MSVPWHFRTAGNALPEQVELAPTASGLYQRNLCLNNHAQSNPCSSRTTRQQSSFRAAAEFRSSQALQQSSHAQQSSFAAVKLCAVQPCAAVACAAGEPCAAEQRSSAWCASTRGRGDAAHCSRPEPREGCCSAAANMHMHASPPPLRRATPPCAAISTPLSTTLL
jgi:hypothetical protein